MVVVSPFSGKKNAWCLCGINVAVVNGSSLLSVSVELDLCYTDPADHLTTVGYQDRDEPVCMYASKNTINRYTSGFTPVYGISSAYLQVRRNKPYGTQTRISTVYRFLAHVPNKT